MDTLESDILSGCMYCAHHADINNFTTIQRDLSKYCKGVKKLQTP